MWLTLLRADAQAATDQTLCAAILHDTVEDTPYTLAALRRDFGTGIAAMVAEHMTLDRLGRRPGRQVTQVMATITSADTRVVAAKLADRLHNMQTLQFLPQAKQLRKAREVLDTFLPVAEQLNMPTLMSELQTLAFAALIRNQPLRPSRRRVIVALDIEGSTSRPDPVKAELRTMLYELFDAALRSAGVSARRRDRFTDRGDGLLALIDPADQALLFNLVIPVFSRLLAGYNASLPDPGGGTANSGSASSCTRGTSTTTTTDASAKPWTLPSACSTPPTLRRRSKRHRAPSCSLSPATSTTWSRLASAA